MRNKLTVILLLFLFLLVTFVCMACKITDVKSEQINPDIISDTKSADSQAEEKRVLSKIVIQRGEERFSFEEKNWSSYNLVSDVENLLMIASRGGAGIDPSAFETDIEVNKIDIVSESEKDIDDKSEVQNKGVWIRLYYHSYRPGQGINDFKHKDIVIYIDPHDGANAYLARQNPDDLSKWDLILLPGYGSWLQKEIEVLLRLKTGF